MRIGILGGSFDPIHFGHLNLAIEMQEAAHLDEVWFFPANLSPFKLDTFPTNVEHRLKMASLATQPVPFFKVCDFECCNKAPSYTIDTIHYLLNTYPDHQYFLILGEDSWIHFPKWKNAEAIQKQVHLLIGQRIWKEKLQQPQNQQADLYPIRTLEISSREIRCRLRDDLFCGHLVPKEVLDYIHRYRLYSR